MPEVNWRELYKAAILELDPVLLQVRVKAAEDAINARLANAQIPRDERRDIDAALSALRGLKRLYQKPRRVTISAGLKFQSWAALHPRLFDPPRPCGRHKLV